MHLRIRCHLFNQLLFYSIIHFISFCIAAGLPFCSYISEKELFSSLRAMGLCAQRVSHNMRLTF